jgi:hypothetical protein
MTISLIFLCHLFVILVIFLYIVKPPASSAPPASILSDFSTDAPIV